jgi:hypothetical protein
VRSCARHRRPRPGDCLRRGRNRWKSGGLTSDEQAGVDSASGYYLGQVDRAGKNAAGTAYGACQQAASDYTIVHRQLFARAFANRVRASNGTGKHRADLRSICLVAVSLAGS